MAERVKGFNYSPSLKIKQIGLQVKTKLYIDLKKNEMTMCFGSVQTPISDKELRTFQWFKWNHSLMNLLPNFLAVAISFSTLLCCCSHSLVIFLSSTWPVLGDTNWDSSWTFWTKRKGGKRLIKLMKQHIAHNAGYKIHFNLIFCVVMNERLNRSSGVVLRSLSPRSLLMDHVK